MRKFLLLGLAAVVLSGCASQEFGIGSQPGRAGLQGMVTAGPTCPVERVGAPPCVAPLAATIVVKTAAGVEVTRFRSAADGTFRVDLAPGTYTLVGISPNPSGLPRPIPVTATVISGQYVQVNVTFDTGIR